MEGPVGVDQEHGVPCIDIERLSASVDPSMLDDLGQGDLNIAN